MPNVPYPILQFWTLSLFYQIDKINIFVAETCVLDNTGKQCGHIYLDGFEETTFLDSGGPFEFILLSVDTAPQDYYNVMLLEWSKGVAERRGIGTLEKLAIARSLLPGPAWKEIFLA